MLKNLVSKRFPIILGISVFIVGMLVTYLLIDYANTTLVDISKLSLDQQGTEFDSALKDKLSISEGVLYSAQVLFVSSDKVERNEWESFVNTLKVGERYPELSTVAYAKKVNLAEKNSFIDSVRKDKTAHVEEFKNFTITPDINKNVYYPIVFTEPLNEISQKSLGFDVSSDAVRQHSMDIAVETGAISYTAPIKSVASDRKLVFGYLPIFKKNLPIATIEQRQEALDGFVILSILPQDLFNNLGKPLTNANGSYKIVDVSSDGTENLLYEVKSSASQKYEVVDLFSIGGRVWKITFTAPQDYALTSLQPTIPYRIFLTGLLISIFLAWIVYSLLAAKNTIQKEVDRISKGLRDSTQKMEAIISNMPIMLWSTDTNGIVTLLEGTGLNDVGLKPGELVGKSARTYMQGREMTETDFLEESLRGKQSHRVSLLGDVYLETWSAPLFDENKKIVGVSGVSINVTEKYKSEADLKKINEMMINRELKMSELKKEIARLKGESE